MYPAYHLQHSNPTLLVSSTSCFSPYLPLLACRGLSQHFVLSIPKQNPHLRSICGETTQLEGRVPIITLHRTLHDFPKGIHKTELFWLRSVGSGWKIKYYLAVKIPAIAWIHMQSQIVHVRSNNVKDRVYNSLYDKMIWDETRWDEMRWDTMAAIYPKVYQIYTSSHSGHLCCPWICVLLLLPSPFHDPCISVHQPSLSSQSCWVAVVVRNEFSPTLSWPALHICQSHSAINAVYIIIESLCQNMSHGLT